MEEATAECVVTPLPKRITVRKNGNLNPSIGKKSPIFPPFLFFFLNNSTAK